MGLFQELLLPPILALLLCCHLGYAFATLALPGALRPYRALLMPLLGCALFLNLAAALTTSTALTPPWIALGLAVLALPANVWAAMRRRTEDRGPRTEDRRPETTERAPKPNIKAWFGEGEGWPMIGCALLCGVVFGLAVLPPLRWGTSLPIGSNWDAAEFYVPLGRALQLASQRDFLALGQSPLTEIFTTAPVAGRIHAFSYLHAAASSAAGVEPLRSYAGMMAFVLALAPLGTYPLGRTLGLPRWAALAGTALAALGWLPLWVAYNNFSNHLMSLPLLPAALAASVVALRDGGRRAIATGGMLVGGLASAYYPAMTAYVAMFAPVALYLVWRVHKDTATRRHGDTETRNDERSFSPYLPFSPSVEQAQRHVIGNGLVLALLAFVLSGAAQAYFFLRSGFLDEMLKRATGFQVNEYVGVADALGLAATFNREALAADNRLVAVAVAVALLLGLLGLAGRRAPLLVAALVGAAAYQGYTAARAYHYGFYKGITFEIPIFALLIAAGAAIVWERTSGRGGEGETRRQGAVIVTPALVSWFLRLVLGGGLALLLALSAWTSWGIQRRYSAAGPQLWSLADTDAAGLRAAVAPGASVLIAPPSGRQPTFNSLLSYALLGHNLMGIFATGYARLDAPPGDQPADLALLPQAEDPANYGYRSEDVRWAGAEMRLYGRAPGVLYHRALGEGGRYPAIQPGASLTLRLGANGIALPGERAPQTSRAGPARLALAIGSFAPTTVELAAMGEAARYELPGGLAEVTGESLELPAEVTVRNLGQQAAYLWWGQLDEPSAAPGIAPRDDVFLQISPEATSTEMLAATIRAHTPLLPDGPQKLTAIVTVNHTPGNESDWQELGQWIFFPRGGQPLRLTADPTRLTAELAADGAPAALVGAATPAGDGKYRATLLLANDARIVYGATLWTWNIRDGTAQNIYADPLPFDVVSLPRPATVLEAHSADGALRLRGYTMPQRTARAGGRIALSLVWQSLRKIDVDMRAQVVVRDTSGQPIADQILPIGAPDHGTHTWQEGETSEQPFELGLPPNTAAGRATVEVALLGADGQALPLEDGTRVLALPGIELR